MTDIDPGIAVRESEIRRLSIAMGVQADEIERLRERVRQLTFWYDQQMGTPCEQIRREQEVERLRAEVVKFRLALANGE